MHVQQVKCSYLEVFIWCVNMYPTCHQARVLSYNRITICIWKVLTLACGIELLKYKHLPWQLDHLGCQWIPESDSASRCNVH
jgi:hypothetical protein